MIDKVMTAGIRSIDSLQALKSVGRGHTHASCTDIFGNYIRVASHLCLNVYSILHSERILFSRAFVSLD